MKPISLQLEAFGPYLDATTIDFEKLNEAGLFLISGSTGGGKTTLLDAMCIALYNTSTGGRRSFSDMRSLTAEHSQRTEVTFTFSLGDAQYRFHRALFMKKKRGSDVYDLHEQHECFRLDGDIWTLQASGAARTVTEFAQNLLSLKAEQFSQVIVLPQGEFLRLLRANSKDKGEILKTLFACESWKNLVLKLGERQKKIYGQRQNLDTALQSLLQKHGAQTPADLEQQIRTLAESLSGIEAALAVDQAAANTVQTALEYARQYELLHKELRTAESQKAEALQKRSAAEKRILESDALTAQIQLLDEALLGAQRKTETLRQEQERSQEKQTIAAEIASAEKRNTQLQADLKTADTVHKDASERIRRGEAFLEEINRCSEALPGLLEQKALLETQRKNAAEYREALSEVTTARDELENRKQQALREKLAVSAQDKAIAAAEAAQKANHAAALAAGLLDGEPCPVCGAVHHPAPAPGSDQLISEAELQMMRQQLEKLRGLWTVAESAVSAAQTKLELSTARMAKAKAACGSDPEPAANLQDKLQSITEQIAKFQKMTSKAAESRQKLQALRTQAERAEKNRAEYTNQLAAIQGELDQLRKRLQSFDTVRSMAKIQEESRGLLVQIQTWTAQRSKLQADQRSASEALAAAKELYAAAEQRLSAAQAACSAFGPAPEQNTEILSEQLTQIQVKIRKQSVLLGSTREALDSARKSEESIHELTAQADQLDSAYSRITRLHGLLSGQKNSLRMPILQYVLSMMLEETIYSANRYFTIFSRGRYALRRMQAPKSGSGYSGLDIEVLDGMSGTCRSIETLSGGEQFLASLSLAFGLSEVVQANSGVVRMDSIFIDEGFGSLDGDTLDTAMKALETIRQSGRVVGIISHVSELRHRIPTMIRVSHKENGSAKAAVISE